MATEEGVEVGVEASAAAAETARAVERAAEAVDTLAAEREMVVAAEVGGGVGKGEVGQARGGSVRAAAGGGKEEVVAETGMAAEAMEAVEAKAKGEEEREPAAAETGKEAAVTAAVERVMEEEG